MIREYIIAPGHSFRMPDGTVLDAGKPIELDDDLAALHAGKVTLAPEAEAAAEAPKVDAPAAAADGAA